MSVLEWRLLKAGGVLRFGKPRAQGFASGRGSSLVRFRTVKL